MRSLKSIGVIGVGLVCCIAFAQEPSQNTTTAENEAVSDDAKINVRNYPLGDLPVWKTDGTYDPNILIALIELSIEPKSWEARGGLSSMAPYSQNASLVVSTTDANHDAIVTVLEQLRR